MADEPATNPVSEGDTFVMDTAAPTQEVDTEGQGETEPQFDEDGNPIEPEAADGSSEDEEIELDDGLKLKVPKTAAEKIRELKEGSLRHADYTRKTQAIAERARILDAVQQSTQEEFDTYAQAKAVEGRLGEYQRLSEPDWRRWEMEDPEAAQSGFREFTLLKDAHQRAMGRLAQLHQQRNFQTQQETARRMEEGRAVLKREITGWNEDLKSNLLSLASEFGFTSEELSDIEADPRQAKLLHELSTLRQAAKTQKTVLGHVAAQAVKPAAKVSGGSSPPGGLDDRADIGTWMRNREKQARQRA